MQRHLIHNKVRVILPSAKLIGGLYQLRRSGATLTYNQIDPTDDVPTGFCIETTFTNRALVRIQFRRTSFVCVLSANEPTKSWLSFAPALTPVQEPEKGQPSEAQVMLCLTRQIGLREAIPDYHDNHVVYRY